MVAKRKSAKPKSDQKSAEELVRLSQANQGRTPTKGTSAVFGRKKNGA